VLVFVALLVRRRLRLVTWFLHTLEIACAKFALTAFILLGVLGATRNAPRPPRAVSPAPPIPAVSSSAPPAPPRAPPPVDPAELRDLAGRVVDPSGRPVTGAIVFVSAGLERYAFEPPRQPVVLINDGTGFAPERSIAQRGQQILARATDGRLHTLLVKAESGTWVRNIPLLTSGAPNALPSSEMEGWFSIRCAVHRAETRQATLILVAHPYFTITAPDGGFALHAVPRAARRIGVASGRGRTDAEWPPDGATNLTITLPGSEGEARP
jgi:hypothetical protein